jgi:hypothetical protein
MPSRRRLVSFALVLVFALAIPAHPQTGAQYYGEIEPRLYTSPELMSSAEFSPVSLEEAKQLGVTARAGDNLYSGNFTLPKDGKVRNIYKAVIERSPDGSDVLYVDENRDGRFEPNERNVFLPVVNAEFAQIKDLASFDVDLAPGGIFLTCPMEVALMKDAASPPRLAVKYTSTAFVRGYAVLPDRRLMVGFEYDFETGGVSLERGREWIDLNDDRRLDMSPGSPDLVQADGSAPIFRAGQLTLQVKTVNLKRDQVVLRTVPAGPQRKRWHLPFQKRMMPLFFTPRGA